MRIIREAMRRKVDKKGLGNEGVGIGGLVHKENGGMNGKWIGDKTGVKCTKKEKGGCDIEKAIN